MGLFKKLKKAFKKVTGAVKKVVKKVVKGVKKVVKKIGSSKILKALAIAAAVVVTGGAALTAFGGTGALASSQFGSWMMSASQSVLGGTAFGTGATTTIGKLAQGAGNFLAKTAAKPFGAVGGALGSTARVGANILTGQSAFAAGPAAGSPVPFSGAALTGQRDMSNFTDAELKKEFNLTDEELDYFKEDIFAQEGSVIAKDASSFTETVVDPSKGITPTASPKPGFWQSGAGEVIRDVGTGVATQVATGAAMQYIQGDPEQQGSMSGAAYEGAEFMDPLKVYAAQQGINTDSIYEHMMYGNADPSTQYGNELYRQQTIGVA
jgi:hypothetical protein